MQQAARQRVRYPCYYKGFYITRSHGHLYAIPPFLDPEEIQYRNRLHVHPAIVSAATQDELEARIDDYDDSPYRPEVVDICEDHQIIRLGSRYFGVPQEAKSVDLNLEDEQRRPGILRGTSKEDVCRQIRESRQAVPVEFAGWLPIYAFSGNCGQHPQFTHTAHPPDGYCFTRSAPSKRFRIPFWYTKTGKRLRAVGRCVWKIRLLARPILGLFRPSPGITFRARWRTLLAVARLFLRLRRAGARTAPILRFLQSRHFQSQAMLADHRSLVFLPSMPYTYNQSPWIIEIEDPTTLFYPHVQNGTVDQERLPESPYFPIVKVLLESDQCRGIITHMQSTARMVATLFRSEIIAQKITYAPLGIGLPRDWQQHAEDDPDHLDLLFVNSWSQIPACFYGRGGLDVLEAFAILRERYPQLRLTMRTSLPVLADHYHRLIESGWVRIIDRFLSAREMAELHAQSHIFLLPAARVHIVSLLQAMSHGLAVVASDGWGIEEYVRHERNGLIVKGRYGKTSWVNEQAGVLCEHYDPTHTADPEVVHGIVEAVSRLVEEPGLRRRLGRTARADVRSKYNLEQWNLAIKSALDKGRLTPIGSV